MLNTCYSMIAPRETEVAIEKRVLAFTQYPIPKGKGVGPVQSKTAVKITIRKTVTTTVTIERSSETQESTTKPVIIVVLDSKG